MPKRILLKKPTLNRKAATVAASLASVLTIGVASVGVASANSMNGYNNTSYHRQNNNRNDYNRQMSYRSSENSTQYRRVYDPYLRRVVVIVFVVHTHSWCYTNSNDRNMRDHDQRRNMHYNNVYWD